MNSYYDTPTWPCRLRPKPDELLSSWLVRQSSALVVKLQTFTTRHLEMHGGFWTMDVDRCADSELFSRLSEHINVHLAVVSNTSLSAYTGTLWEQYHTGPLPFITSIGKLGRRRKNFGQQYCRLCLQEDAEPYFRKSWRLAFRVSCLRHGIYLRDCCPACKAPVEFHSGDFAKLLIPEECQITICPNCSSDFRHAPDDDIKIPHEIAEMQFWLDGCLRDGFGSIDGRNEYPALLIFNGLRKLLTTYTSITRTSRVVTGIKHSYGELDLRPGFGNQSHFENIRIGDRAWGLMALYKLLEHWPNEFVRMCRESRISSSYLTSYREQLPFWLASTLNWYLHDEDYSPSAQERTAVAEYLKRRDITVNQSNINLLLGTSAVSVSRKLLRRRWNPRGILNNT